MLENKEDGIPFLTQKPIKPGETYVYKFKISQNGTYWYHSHQGLQEQMGMYGMLVFRKRGETSRSKSSGRYSCHAKRMDRRTSASGNAPRLQMG